MKLHESIREHLRQKLLSAKSNGQDYCVLISGDIHEEMNLVNRMPSVCREMKKMMGSDDQILHTTPRGNSNTIKIGYHLS
jgi:hypothetical protein